VLEINAKKMLEFIPKRKFKR